LIAMYDETHNHCSHLGRERLMELGKVTSQIYEWLKCNLDRKPRRLKALPVKLVEQTVAVILRYPHWGGKKGRVFMLYQRVALVAEKAYQWIKVAVMWCIQSEIRSRHLLPKHQEHTHKPPALVGDVWSADFTHVQVAGVVVYLSVVRDNKSLYTLGSEASLGAGKELVLSPLRQALASTDGKGPKEFQLTDRGAQYRSRDYEKALDDAGITHVLVPPREPWYNGVCENGMKTLKQHFYRLWYARPDRPALSNRKEILQRAKACLGQVIKELNDEIPCPSLQGVTPHDVFAGTAETRREQTRAFEAEEKIRIKEKESETESIDRKNVPKLVRQLVHATDIKNDELVVLSLLLGGKPMRWLNRGCPEGVG
jgi:transposase InsO family protein